LKLNDTQISKCLIIGFVDNRAFNESRTLNPFNFHHYKINFLSLYVDGTQIPVINRYKQILQKRNCIRTFYHTLFSGNRDFLNERNSISRENYLNYCLFALDLTPDFSANDNTHWNLIKHGNVRIEVRFEEALQNTVTSKP